MSKIMNKHLIIEISYLCIFLLTLIYENNNILNLRYLVIVIPIQCFSRRVLHQRPFYLIVLVKRF